MRQKKENQNDQAIKNFIKIQNVMQNRKKKWVKKNTNIFF